MRALTVTGVIRPDHTMIVQVPEDIPLGTLEVVIVLQEDGSRVQQLPFTANWPAHPVGPVDPNMTYRREDMYGDDGR